MPLHRRVPGRAVPGRAPLRSGLIGSLGRAFAALPGYDWDALLAEPVQKMATCKPGCAGHDYRSWHISGWRCLA